MISVLGFRAPRFWDTESWTADTRVVRGFRVPKIWARKRGLPAYACFHEGRGNLVKPRVYRRSSVPCPKFLGHGCIVQLACRRSCFPCPKFLGHGILQQHPCRRAMRPCPQILGHGHLVLASGSTVPKSVSQNFATRLSSPRWYMGSRVASQGTDRTVQGD